MVKLFNFAVLLERSNTLWEFYAQWLLSFVSWEVFSFVILILLRPAFVLDAEVVRWSTITSILLSGVGSLSTYYFVLHLLSVIVIVLLVARTSSSLRFVIWTFKISSCSRGCFWVSNWKHFKQVYLLFVWNIEGVSTKVLIKVVLFFLPIHWLSSINKWQWISTVAILVSKLIPARWCFESFIYELVLLFSVWHWMILISMWRTLIDIAEGFLSLLILVGLWTWRSMVVEVVVKQTLLWWNHFAVSKFCNLDLIDVLILMWWHKWVMRIRINRFHRRFVISNFLVSSIELQILREMLYHIFLFANLNSNSLVLFVLFVYQFLFPLLQ